jgi:hypothetical protein
MVRSRLDGGVLRQPTVLWLAALAYLLCFVAPVRAGLTAESDTVDLGSIAPGSAYSSDIKVKAVGTKTHDVSATIVATSGSIESVSPETFQANPFDWTVVTVNGTAPSSLGSFSDDVRFFYEDAGGTFHIDVKVTGVAASEPPPPVEPPPATPDYAVGVIPQTAACPAGTSLVSIHMDDEDTRNQSAAGGWIGATTSNGNTTFRFCRVDGRQFKPLATTNAVANHYAVLMLGNTCPSGSSPFQRLFDNEHRRNLNKAWSSSGDASDLGPTISMRTPAPLTRLFFCLFKSGAAPMAKFPNLGYAYGVFAAPGFSKTAPGGGGWVYTDDQDADSANGNQFLGDVAGKAMVVPTGSNGRNTTLHIQRVDPQTKPVAACSGNPNAAYYKLDTTWSSSSYAQPGRSLVKWSWLFDTGVTLEGPGPFSGTYYNYSTVPGPQYHSVTLTVTDDLGETGTTTCTVQVDWPPSH